MIEQLMVRLIGDGSSYQAMMKGAEKQLTSFQGSVEGVNRKIGQMGQNMTAMGTKLSMAVTAPIVGMGAAAVNEFAKFDKAMTESTSIMGNLSDNTKTQMRELATTLSTQGKQGPDELAKSYYFLASAGLNAEEAMAALPVVQKFATAGAFDMALATDLLTDAQSALGLATGTAIEKQKEMTRVGNVLVRASTLANASVQQFSESLTNTAGATLKNFNKSVEEGVAVLAAYADQGVKANVAGTNLTRVTLLLQQAAQKNAKAHKELGFSVFDSDEKMKSYADIIANLEEVTAGMTDETKAATLAQLGFQARVQNAILPLIGQSEKIREYQAELDGVGNIMETVANEQMKAFSNQLVMTKNRTKALMIEVGQALAPVLIQLNDKLQEVTKWFASLDNETKTTIATIVALAAALGPVMIVLGMVVTHTSSLIGLFIKLGPLIYTIIAAVASFVGWWVVIIAILAGVVAAVNYLGLSWKDLGTTIANVIDLASDYMIAGFRIFNRSVTVFVGWAAKQFTKLFTMDFVNSVIEGMKAAGRAIVQFGEWAMKKLRAIWTGEETGSFEDAVEGLKADLAAGFGEEDLLGTLARIKDEELAHLSNRRADNKEIVPEALAMKVKEGIQKAQMDVKGLIPKIQLSPNQKPIETKPVTDSEQSKDTKDIASGVKEMVNQLERLIDKDPVELEGAGL